MNHLFLHFIIVSAKPKFEILELHDIEKEFMLVDARLRLISKDPDAALAAGKHENNPLSPKVI